MLVTEDVLERDGELTALTQRIDAVASDRAGGAILIEGVPGIGKSTLLWAAVEAARAAARPTVLEARGSELEFELTFGGVRQLLGRALQELAPAQLAQIASGPAALAAPVLGLRADSPPPGLSDPLYGLFWLVTNLAERAPLVLAIDDLQWLDVESQRFVAYLLARIEGAPILVLATARSPEPGVDDVATAVQATFTTVIRPQPLSPAAVGSIVADRPADHVHRLTGGNPLLVAEIGRSLASAPRGTPLEELGSPTVARLVLDRVAKVSPQALALARAVALFGAGALLADAAAVAELAIQTAAEAADALVAHQVLAGDERLAFVHPMMRAAVYEQLGAFARRRGHATAAAALRARGAAPEEIAAHLLAGEPAGDPANLALLIAAADEARAAVAPRAAARYLERAVAEGAADGAQLRKLLLDLGRLQRQISHPDATRTLMRAFELSARAEDRIEAAVELAAGVYAAADYAGVTRVVEQTRGVDARPDDRLMLEMLQAEALWSAGDRRGCFELIERVPPDLPGDTPAQRFALVQSAAVRFMRGAPNDEVLELLLRSVGDRGADALVAGVDVGDPIGWLISCDALDVALALAEERLELARETGNEALFAWSQYHVGWIMAYRGELLASEAAFRLGLGSPALSAWARGAMVINFVETLIMRGAWDDASAELDAESFADAVFASTRRAEIALWRGDPALALELMKPASQADLEVGVRHPSARIWEVERIDALTGVGRNAEAAARARELVDAAVRVGGTYAHGQFQAALGRATGDLDDLRAAHALTEPSPFRWLAARVNLDLGAALRRAGERVAARDHLRCALDYAERQKVVHFAERAREELRVAGARPRRAALSGWDSLTPSEERMARLAAEGRSNKQIAQHLFLTVKTVEMTLIRAYRKLDISSRRELTGAMAPAARA